MADTVLTVMLFYMLQRTALLNFIHCGYACSWRICRYLCFYRDIFLHVYDRLSRASEHQCSTNLTVVRHNNFPDLFH